MERRSDEGSSRLIPMWAITGRPEREQVEGRMRGFHARGIDEVLLYPRSGLEIPYASEDWFALCATIAGVAESLGMGVWLYDEFNWPSGNCDGRLFEGHPEFVASEWLATREGGSLRWRVEARPPFPDVLNPEATRRFIALTHERYAQALGRRLGSVVRGIFTDEPSFIYPAYNSPVKDAAVSLPYYDGVEEDYARATGREPRRDVERVLGGEAVPDLFPTFYALVGRRFVESYLRPLRRWCDEHGILLTGHLFEEHAATRAVMSNGEPFACLEQFSLPGLDEIGTRTTVERAEWLTLKTLQSVALRRGGGALAELFALGPPDVPLGTVRQMLYLAALHGVDHYVLAITPFDARGSLKKRDWFMAFSPIQPWFDHLPLLAEEGRRASAVARELARGALAVVYPWREAAAHAGPLARRGPMPPLEGRLRSLLEMLVRRQWPARLVREGGDPSSAATRAVISLEGEGFRVRRLDDGRTAILRDTGSLAEWLESHVTRDACLRDGGGALADDVLVETLAGGDLVLLNLSEVDRPGLVARREGAPDAAVSLPPRGCLRVTACGAASPPPAVPVGRVDSRFRLGLDRPNLLRCAFDGAECVVVARQPIDGVRLLVRRGASEEWRLDGRLLAADRPCTLLPEGLRELYTETEALSLARGEHRVSAAKAVDDAPYLPAALVAGAFGVFGGELGALPEEVGCADLRGLGLGYYAGRVVLRSRLQLPPGPRLRLRLDPGANVAEVALGGRALGARAWEPIEWAVPDDLAGREVECVVTLTTSIGALYGPAETFRGGATEAYWPGRHLALGILRPIEFLREERTA